MSFFSAQLQAPQARQAWFAQLLLVHHAAPTAPDLHTTYSNLQTSHLLLTLVPRGTHVVAIEAMLSINLGALQSRLYIAKENRAEGLAAWSLVGKRKTRFWF